MYDADSTPLESCNILLQSKFSNNIILHTYSDSIGHFKLLIIENNILIDTVILIINSFGYKSKYFAVDSNILNQLQNIYLENLDSQIEEIIITEKAYEIRNKDTLIYNLNNYRDSFESSIGQVLNKLPGVNVTQEGNVTVYGVPITNITIDGDDITGSRYQVITNTLNPNLIQSAEIILNYEENSILAEIYDNKTISINLITNEILKNNFSSSVMLSMGIPKSYESSIDGIGLYKKVKILSNLKFNNIGQGIPGLSLYDVGEFVIKPNTKDPPLMNQAEYAGMSQDLSRINEHLGVQNLFLFKINKSTKISINHFYDTEKFEKINNLAYLLKIGGTLRTDSLDQNSNIKQNAFAIYFNSRLNKNVQLKINLGTSLNHIINDQNTLEYKYNIQNRYKFNSIYSDFITRISKKSATQTTFQIINNNQVSNSKYFFPSQTLYPYSVSATEIYQSITQPFVRTSIAQTFYQKLKSSNILLGIGWNNLNSSPDLSINNNSLTISSSVRMNYQDMNAFIGIDSKLSKDIELNTKIQNGILISKIHSNEKYSNNRNYINIISSLLYKMNSKRNIKLTIGRTTSFTNNYLFFNDYRLNNRFSFLKNELPIAINTSLLGYLRYNYNSTIPLLKFYADINYSRNNSPYVINTNFRSNSSLYDGELLEKSNSAENIGVNMGVENLLKKVSTNIKFKPFLYCNKQLILVNNISRNLTNTNLGFAINIGTGFNLPINGSIGFEPLWSKSTVSSPGFKNTTKSSQRLYFGDIRYNTGIFSMKWNNSIYHSSSISNFNKINSISNFNAKIRLPKSKLSFDTRIFNIFNNKEIRTLINTQNYQIDDNAIQRGRFIMIGISTNLN